MFHVLRRTGFKNFLTFIILMVKTDFLTKIPVYVRLRSLSDFNLPSGAIAKVKRSENFTWSFKNFEWKLQKKFTILNRNLRKIENLEEKFRIKNFQIRFLEDISGKLLSNVFLLVWFLTLISSKVWPDVYRLLVKVVWAG